MSRWFRVYSDLIDNPKYIKLGPDLRSALFGVWCVASANGGVLPALDFIAIKFRINEQRTKKLLQELERSGFIDRDEDGALRPHDWDERQFQSDTSNERVKRYRQRQRNVTVTPPEADTEQKQSRTDARDESSKRVGDFCQAIVRVYAEANSPSLPETSRAQLWLSQGYDPEICLGVIRDIVKRKPNATLAYFDKPIAEAHTQRAPPRVRLVEPPRQDFGEAAKSWLRFRTWPKGHGPDPDSPACQCPRELLKPSGQSNDHSITTPAQGEAV